MPAGPYDFDLFIDHFQAFFGVFDGHGGRAAVDFVSKKLGQNIIGALAGGEKKLEAATRLGYLTTDAQFLSQVTKQFESFDCSLQY